ncbi:MAG: ABC transporter permease [Longibaculum muris]|uniref:ABC-2 type transport system permease protein n=1 Tax=Longibaculum muris TaxID=1796628 RepID=A0A4R3Z6Z4_9FIRM|nr:ABC transporter [Longibaculum muris]KXU40747.1 ABC-2 type transporter [Candidatus Stoquefichus sp. KLE1796]MCR1886957.1 ABC transporter permease [Longibaculum muris]MED9811591.1 ABC transporter permease [Longibaculum muris]TCW02988.1 ABC-2 type transport system permease protein [Longibaculum muris]
MSYHVIKAIFIKQYKDTLKNISILIQLIMFPAISIVMTSSIQVSEIPSQYFVILFATMYVGMTPIIMISNIMGEEKEKGSLKMLMMSNVKPTEYILGVSLFVMVGCLIGLFVMAMVGGYRGIELITFVGICSLGMLTSIFLGSVIGIVAKDQIASNSLSVPAMLICSFVPMLSMFNENIRHYGGFIYTQQINELLTHSPITSFSLQPFVIIFLNMMVLLGIYIYVFQKRKL